MLKNNLSDISKIIYLRSDKLLYELILDTYDENIDDVRINGMKDFYPNTHRIPNIKNAISHTKQQQINDEFDFLINLFEDYFVVDRVYIYAKKDLLEDYSALINKIHPYNIIGYYLAKQMRDNNISIYNIEEIAYHISNLGFDVNRHFQEYADNHIHLGGSIDDSSSIVKIFDKDLKEFDEKRFTSLPRINEFSYINTQNLTFRNLIKIAKFCISVINNYALFNEIKKIDFSQLLYDDMYNVEFASTQNISKTIKLTNIISGKYSVLVKNMLDFYDKKMHSKYWFLFNVLMFSIYLDTDNNYLKRTIKIFIHISNIIRSYTLMSQNIGLSSFSGFSRSAFKNNHNNISDIATNIITNGTTKFEVKISPSSLDEKLPSFKIGFDDKIVELQKQDIKDRFDKYFLNTNKSKIKYHFCVHFIRENDNTKRNEDFTNARFYKLRKELQKQVLKLDKLLKHQYIMTKFEMYRKHTPMRYEVYNNANRLNSVLVDISKLISTIDIAGDENRTPPEVFAPIVKFLRRDFRKIDEFRLEYIKNLNGDKFLDKNKLKLSVHAGEDFDYIITGIRKIDETIKFYHMKKDDRLGHALAIGLNVKEWLKRNGDIFVSKQEYLDNLIWVYHKSIDILPYCKVVSKIREKYLRIIKKLSFEIYGEVFSLYDLYKAWEIREFCPIYFDEIEENEYIQIVKFNKNKEEYKKAIEINNLYQHKKEVYDRGSEIIKIDYKRNSEYSIDDDDLEFIEAMQDLMIEEIAQKGIVIETNPTSNVYISYLNDYSEHPIFRWKPITSKKLNKKYNKFSIRKTKVRVCINTDDPSIMPTTLRNEFDVIKNSALCHSKNIEKIDKWIDEIREEGVKIFDFNHKNHEIYKER